jgi:hypothetical protein
MEWAVRMMLSLVLWPMDWVMNLCLPVHWMWVAVEVGLEATRLHLSERLL